MEETLVAMKGAAKIRRFGSGATVVAAWGASAAFVYGGFYCINAGVEWLSGGPNLEVPGEACEAESHNAFTGEPASGICFPLPGWHFEPYPNDRAGDAYVRDGADDAQRRIDVATSFLWSSLSRQQQREILDGHATIEKFRPAKEIDEAATER
jgi:hypothetical protein